MKNKIQIIIIFLCIITLSANAQQDAQYTQYMYNMSVINPAYTTGDIGTVNLGLLHRTQWVSVTGAPKTASFFAHTAIDDKIEVGISFVNDNIGDVVRENNIFGDFAYKLDLEENGNISFGLKAGVTFFDVDFNGFNLESGGISTDPNFANPIHKTYLNIGTGVYYNTDNYYVGLSIPNILKSTHLDENNGQYQGTENSHVFLTGGYVFDINEEFRLKPAFMTKFVKGAPTSLDITANVLYQERFELGVGYRVNDAFSILANFRANDELRIGYAYDSTISNLGPFSSGSHEIIILYDLDILGLNKGYDKSPRFF
jgi:type IX secretion system PorP/SprF family membrane protein